MAKKRRTTTTEEEVEEMPVLVESEHADADPAMVETPEDQALLDAALELGASGASDAKITIRRLMPNGDREVCFSCSPEEFSLDRIREEWGPGKYQIYGRKDKKFAFNRVITLAAPPPRPKADREAETHLIRDLAERMERQQAAQFQQFRDLLALALSRQQAAPAIDPIAMQKNFLDQLQQARDLFAPRNAGAGGGDAVELLLKGITLGRELTPSTGADASDVLLEVVRKFGGPLAAAAMQTPPAAADPPAAAGVEGSRPALPAKDQTMMVLKMQLAHLVRKAKQGSAPGLYAELILDNLPEAQVREFIAAPDALDRLILLNPEVAAVRPWFEQLRAELEALLAGDDDGGEDLTNGAPPAHATAQEIGRGKESAARSATGDDAPAAPRGNGGH